MKNKLILEEPVDEVVKSTLTEDTESEVEKEHEEEAIPEVAQTTEVDFGIASMINGAIIDEFEAIDTYNSLLVTIQNLKQQTQEVSTLENFDSIVRVITDIVNEENIHVGQLQKILGLVSANAAFIKEGDKEAEEVLEK